MSLCQNVTYPILLDSLRNTKDYQDLSSYSIDSLKTFMLKNAYSDPTFSIASSINIIDKSIRPTTDVINSHYNILSQLIYQGNDVKNGIDYIKELESQLITTNEKNLLKGHIALLTAITSDLGENHIEGIKLDQEAITYYEKVNHPNIIRAYGGLALLNYEMKFYDEALKYYDIMFELLEKNPNYENKILLLNNYVIMISEQPYYYNNKELLTDAEKVNKEIFELLNKKFIPRNLLWAKINQYQLDRLNGKLVDNNTLTELTQLIDGSDNIETKIYFYRLVAQSNLKSESLNKSQSLFFLNKAIDLANSNQLIEQQLYNYQVMTAYNYHFGSKSELRNTQLKVDSLSNAFYSKKNREEIAKLEVGLKMKNLELEKKEIESKVQNHRLIIAIVSLIAFSLISLIYYYRKRLMLYAALKKSENNLKMAYEELLTKNKVISNQQITLIKKNNQINKELKTSLLILSSYASIKQKVIKVLNDRNTNFNEKRMEILSIIENKENIEYLENINFKFIETNSGFTKNLLKEFPHLTENNIKLCIMIKMQLNINEIAAALFVEPSSIKVAKYRLRKKLGLKNSDIKLLTFLEQFEEDNNNTSHESNVLAEIADHSN